MNAMIVESFGIRGGKIHEVEAMPYVTIPCGLGDGWTEGSGRRRKRPLRDFAILWPVLGVTIGAEAA